MHEELAAHSKAEAGESMPRVRQAARWVVVSWRGIVCGLLFILLGSQFVGYAGIQTDEALFAGPLCRSWRFFSVPFGGHHIPLMNMSYNGALKTWLYAPFLIHAARPTPALIRGPALIIGATTILLFWCLLRQVHSPRAAMIGCLLLATDASFLLTTTYDWGPVVLQHLLLVAAMTGATTWFQTRSLPALAAAAFCCGLAFWDKAVFVWVLTGLLAGIVPIARKVAARLTRHSVGAVLTSFLLGAAPMILYNFSGPRRFETVRSNAKLCADFSCAALDRKVQVLGSTLNGSALFGYLVNEDWAPQPKFPHSTIQRASAAIRNLTGEHRSSGLALWYGASLLCLPFLWKTRARKVMVFCAIASAVAWAFMAVTDGGGAAHHAVLLWPFPQMIIAAALSELIGTHRALHAAGAALVVLLVSGNVLVINQYLYQFDRNGSPTAWTDAIYPLAAGLRSAGATQVVLPDWGLTDSLCFLNHDNPPMRLIDSDSFLASNASEVERKEDLKAISDVGAVWILHTVDHETLPGVNDRTLNRARAAGFEPILLKTYSDTNGRAMFQTFRFLRRTEDGG